jgi:hypothetical protein
MRDWGSYLRWRSAFVAAMDPELYPPEWLDGRLLAGTAQFWLGEQAAAVTEVRAYPTGAYDVHGLVAAGDMHEVRGRIVPQIEAWARSIGAIALVVESRPGWARALKGTGFEPHQLAVRKPL